MCVKSPVPLVMTGNSSPSFSVFEEVYNCYNTTAGAIGFTIFSIINVSLNLPLCIFVLSLGLRQWRQQTPNTPMSHCDILTFNIVLIDLVQIIGSMISCYSIYTGVSSLITAGIHMLWIYLAVQMTFFTLTCVDYYLAVVFPIFYLSLRKPKFIKARNTIISFVWISNITTVCSLRFLENRYVICFLSIFTAFFLSFVIFSCFSVLYVLIRPGPGERGRHQVDHLKLKAFNTMLFILTVMTVRFVGASICNALYASVMEVTADKRCVVWLSLVCNSFPYSLLQPILFLQKTGKLPFCKNK